MRGILSYINIKYVLLLVLIQLGNKLLCGETIVLFAVSRAELSTVHRMEIGLPINSSRALPLQHIVMLKKEERKKVVVKFLNFLEICP